MAKKAATEEETETKVEDGYWGEAFGVRGTWILMGYLAVIAIMLIIATVWLFWGICIDSESAGICTVRIVAIVLVLGALGAQIKCLRSLVWHVGKRDLEKSWMPSYLLSPLVGAMLALVFYLLVRGGLLAMNAEMKTVSDIGLAGASALVGMFSDEASVKFKMIASAIFSEAEKDEDKG